MGKQLIGYLPSILGTMVMAAMFWALGLSFGHAITVSQAVTSGAVFWVAASIWGIAANSDTVRELRRLQDK